MSSADKATLVTLAKVKSEEHLISRVSKIVVNTLVTTLVNASKANLAHLLGVSRGNVNEIFNLDIAKDDQVKNAIGYDTYGSEKHKTIVKAFQKRMSTVVLYTYDVQRSDSKGKYIIKNLFEAYYTNPQQLSNSAIRNFRKATKKFKTEDYVNIGEMRSEFENYIRDYRTHDRVEDDLLLMRTICDYIAGMTDSFAISEYEKLYG